MTEEKPQISRVSSGVGKRLSLFSKIVAVLFVISATIISIIKTGTLPTADQALAIVQIAIFISSVFFPVDLSKIIENIKGGRS